MVLSFPSNYYWRGSVPPQTTTIVVVYPPNYYWHHSVGVSSKDDQFLRLQAGYLHTFQPLICFRKVVSYPFYTTITHTIRQI